MGSYFMSITRGLISVCVPIEDLGKIFAFISTLDGLSPMVMSQIYASIWKVGNFAGNTIFYTFIDFLEDWIFYKYL